MLLHKLYWQKLHYNNYTAKTFYNSCTATIALQKLYCNNYTATITQSPGEFLGLSFLWIWNITKQKVFITFWKCAFGVWAVCPLLPDRAEHHDWEKKKKEEEGSPSEVPATHHLSAQCSHPPTLSLFHFPPTLTSANLAALPQSGNVPVKLIMPCPIPTWTVLRPFSFSYY